MLVTQGNHFAALMPNSNTLLEDRDSENFARDLTRDEERISKLADICAWGAEDTPQTPLDFCRDVVSRCKVSDQTKAALVEGVAQELARRAIKRGEAAA